MSTAVSSQIPGDYPWLRRCAKLLCLATLLLIYLGGQVKSHDAGLSVPDWPLTYGENPVTYPVSKWVGGIFHEHFHRLVAGGVALLTVVLAVWLALSRCAAWLKWLGGLAVVAVLLQALLGGLTVIYQLPVWMSSAHAVLAQTFLGITVILAYAVSVERRDRLAALREKGPEPASPMRAGAVLLVAAIFIQLFLGALMRHTESGLAIPDFPRTAGNIIPRFDDGSLAWVNEWRSEFTFETGTFLPDVTRSQMLIHFAHRLGAVAVVIVALALLLLARRNEDKYEHLLLTLNGIASLIGVQFLLGVTVIWTAKSPMITSIHVAVGAAVLALAVLLVLRAWPLNMPESPQSGDAPALEAAPAR